MLQEKNVKIYRAVYFSELPFDCEQYIKWFADGEQKSEWVIKVGDIQYQFDMLLEKDFCGRVEVRKVIKKLYAFAKKNNIEVFINL